MQCVDLQAGTAHQNKHLGYGLTAHFAMNRWPVSWAHSSTDKRSSKATRTGWRRDGDGGGGHRWRWPPIRCDPARNSASTRCFWLDRWMDGWIGDEERRAPTQRAGVPKYSPSSFLLLIRRDRLSRDRRRRCRRRAFPSPQSIDRSIRRVDSPRKREEREREEGSERKAKTRGRVFVGFRLLSHSPLTFRFPVFRDENKFEITTSVSK